ncbi:hypothetical protein B0H34DRAFT_738824 [Crassisporium funariophilum]|nr:hypothetical protein B0H34DRAFT_738824 [Crassisporium funariophilum]
MPATSLTPPAGTCYFRAHSEPLQIYTHGWSVNGRVDYRIYCTGSKPQDNFASHGGKLYFVMTMTVDPIPDNNYPATALKFGLRDKNGHMKATDIVLPNTYREEGSQNHYYFDYKKTLQLFKDKGNQTFNFDVEVDREFDLTSSYILYPVVDDSGFHGFDLSPQSTRQVLWSFRQHPTCFLTILCIQDEMLLATLLVFTADELAWGSLEFSVEVEGKGSSTHTWDIDFTKNTMLNSSV